MNKICAPLTFRLDKDRLRSFIPDSLFVPAVRLSAVGRRAYPVAGARVWDDLTSHITSSPSLLSFRPKQ